MEGIFTLVLFFGFIWIIASLGAKNSDSIRKINKKASRKAKRQTRRIVNAMTKDDDD